MKVVIQHRRTLQYWKSPDLWIDDVEGAESFDSSVYAYDLCLQKRIKDTQIVLLGDVPEGNIYVNGPKLERKNNDTSNSDQPTGAGD
jgi:hypothetical protein